MCLVDSEHVALDTETFQQELRELRLRGGERQLDHGVGALAVDFGRARGGRSLPPPSSG